MGLMSKGKGGSRGGAWDRKRLDSVWVFFGGDEVFAGFGGGGGGFSQDRHAGAGAEVAVRAGEPSVDGVIHAIVGLGEDF